jgi:hypothetical protein
MWASVHYFGRHPAWSDRAIEFRLGSSPGAPGRLTGSQLGDPQRDYDVYRATTRRSRKTWGAQQVTIAKLKLDCETCASIPVLGGSLC